jgi:hypothetical protein
MYSKRRLTAPRPARLLGSGRTTWTRSHDLDDLHRRSVVALKEREELSGNGPLQASPDIADALALGPPPGGIGAGVGVIAEPGHHHGVERPVELWPTREAQPAAPPGRHGDGAPAGGLEPTPLGRRGRRPGRRSWPRCAAVAAWAGRPRPPAHNGPAGRRPARRRSCRRPPPPRSADRAPAPGRTRTADGSRPHQQARTSDRTVGRRA